jgi:hypothetical protein
MKRRPLIFLANAAALSAEMFLPNELELVEGWAMLAPYGDKVTLGTPANLAEFRLQFPNAKIDSAGRVAVIQRVDHESAVAMANDFNGVRSRVLRFFKGAPIYSGHPDMPGMAARYPDKSHKGTIARLEARAGQGLYCMPIFNDEGDSMLSTKKGLGFSGRWVGEPTGEENGQLVYKPVRFISAGLTDSPNLPVELLNTTPEMDLKKLIGLIVALKAPGIVLTNESTEDQVAAAISGLAAPITASLTLENERTTFTTERTNLTTERDRLKVDLANERKAHVGSLLTAAIADGRITEADRAKWEGRLTANFANEAADLAALKPKFKTAPETDGSRKGGGPAEDAGAQLVTLANSKIAATPGLAWDAAWILACNEKPALLQALSAPAA